MEIIDQYTKLAELQNYDIILCYNFFLYYIYRNFKRGGYVLKEVFKVKFCVMVRILVNNYTSSFVDLYKTDIVSIHIMSLLSPHTILA